MTTHEKALHSSASTPPADAAETAPQPAADPHGRSDGRHLRAVEPAVTESDGSRTGVAAPGAGTAGGDGEVPSLWMRKRQRKYTIRSRAEQVRATLIAAGGVATRAQLQASVSDRALRTAVDKGLIMLLRPGVYGVPASLDESELPDARADAAQRAQARAERVGHARRVATLAGGVMSHLSAAEYYELPVLHDPAKPAVLVRRGRRLDSRFTRRATVRRRAISDTELERQVTDPLRTVLDCAADLDSDAEALAVLDSALRGSDEYPPLVARSQLLEAAEQVSTLARARVRRRAAAADGAAANPAESALRAIALPVEGLTLRAQVHITCEEETFRVDLADEAHRIVIEFESVEWHTGQERIIRDCRRYSILGADGWIVLRFCWDDVVNHPERTRATIHRALRFAQGLCRRCDRPPT